MLMTHGGIEARRFLELRPWLALFCQLVDAAGKVGRALTLVCAREENNGISATGLKLGLATDSDDSCLKTNDAYLTCCLCSILLI